MGVAGGGKSAQGRLLADELGLPWLSTGEFLRMLLSGQERKDMVSGKLLNDQQTIALVEWLLSQEKAGLLDITAIFHITADQKIVQERLLKRGRQDDTQEAINE